MLGFSSMLLTLLSAAPANFSSVESMDQQQCAFVETTASTTVLGAVSVPIAVGAPAPATAALASASSAPASSLSGSAMPTLGLAGPVALAPLPSTNASPTDGAPCSYEPAWTAAPAVIDCNDVRSSIWVGSMIGSCDMPRNLFPPSLGRGAQRPLRGTFCEGPTCGRHGTPLRAPDRSDEDPRPMMGSALLLIPPSTYTPLFVGSLAPLRSALRDRIERPPRV